MSNNGNKKLASINDVIIGKTGEKGRKPSGPIPPINQMSIPKTPKQQKPVKPQGVMDDMVKEISKEIRKGKIKKVNNPSCILEPETSLLQQVINLFGKEKEQKFQNQVEIPPKGNNNN